MNIAILAEQVDAQRGGAETSTLEMAQRLARLGTQVTIVSGGPAAEERTLPDGVALRVLKVSGATKAARTRAYLRAANELCGQGTFHLVHAIAPCEACDVYQPRGGTYPETIRRSAALPRSAGLGLAARLGRVFNARQRLLLQAERRLLARRPAPFIAALSDYVARQVREAAPGFPNSQIRVVFNGVDVEATSDEPRAARRAAARRELGIGVDEAALLFVAHNFKLKGLRELLRAIALLSYGPRPPLLLVAGRDREAPFRRMAVALGVAERVRFLGPARDASALYLAADGLAHPTWYDPCSRVVLEALAYGLPVVTTRYNGAAEIMQPDVHGVVIDDPSDTASLAEALRRVLDPGLAVRCAREREATRERVSMPRHARELLGLYEEIVSAKRSPAPATARH